jgi:hypothetical protein
MNHTFNISLFGSYSTAQKVGCFDNDIQHTIGNLSDKDLYLFLRDVTLDDQENLYVRKKALQTFINFILLKRLKVRQGLSLLVDDWVDSGDTFLEVQRFKELFLFFEKDEIVEEIFQEGTNSDESEISSECLLNLGLIKMQEAFSSKRKEECLLLLEKSLSFFQKSNQEIENRIDANIYSQTVSILVDLLSGRSKGTSWELKNLGNSLFKKDVYSFQPKEHHLYCGFYRALWGLVKIKENSPSQWLDFRAGLNELLVYYAEIHNQQLKDRLSQHSLYNSYVSILKSYLLEPFFALSFKSDLARLDKRIAELTPSSYEYQFLTELKEIAEDSNKKKIESTSLEERFQGYFPTRSKANISEVVSRIKDPDNPHEILNAYDELSLPTGLQLLDNIVSACVRLQGNRIYRGTFSEDDRNTYIADLLESSGYYVKDQTRWSISYEGKSAGEIDIFIRDKFGVPLSIVEALNLDSLKKDYTAMHLDKIFNYDTSGLKSNFILIYSNAKGFSKLWNKYQDFIKNHPFQYKLISFVEIRTYGYADILAGKSVHNRNGKKVDLYHVTVNLYED